MPAIKARKLTVFVGESHTRHGRPVYQLVVEAAKARGLAGATVTRGIMGFGASGAVHVPHPDLASKLPVRVEIVDQPEAIDALLPDVYDLVDDGMVELSDVELVRLGPKEPKPAPAHAPHVKLQGQARMLRVLFGAADTWQGEPLHEALIRRFHLLDLAGVTLYRGEAGYGASGRMHRRKLWRSADAPLTLVVVDTAENLAKALPAVEEMVGSGLVVMHDVDVIVYR
jgi:PII-like signaling protein